MKTLRKFPLFIALLLVLGCENKRVIPAEATKAPEPVQLQENDGEEEGSLETRCFDGDPEACDELGH